MPSLVIEKLIWSRWSPYTWTFLSLCSFGDVILYWHFDKSGVFLFLYLAIGTGILAVDLWIAKIKGMPNGPIRSFTLSLLHR